MFRDDAQKAAVCRVLLGQVGLARLFDAAGPTPEIQALWKEGSGEHDGDARLLLRTVEALWTGGGGPKLDELRCLSPESLVAVGALLRCLSDSPEMVDSWLKAAPVQE